MLVKMMKTLHLVLCIAVFTTAVLCSPVQTKCLKICPKILMHVCGSDGRTYENRCRLEVQKCKNDHNLTAVSNGSCINGLTSCPDTCPDERDPVCGSDGRTYPSRCHLSLENCNRSTANAIITVARKGECGENVGASKPNCQGVRCLMNIGFVCGSDGITYPSPCYLDFINCNKSSSANKITIVSKGPCKSSKDGADTSPAATTTTATINAVSAADEVKFCKNKVCQKIMNPVCGTNGMTYNNECMIRAENCDGQNQVAVKHVGVCFSEASK